MMDFGFLDDGFHFDRTSLGLNLARHNGCVGTVLRRSKENRHHCFSSVQYSQTWEKEVGNECPRRKE